MIICENVFHHDPIFPFQTTDEKHNSPRKHRDDIDIDTRPEKENPSTKPLPKPEKESDDKKSSHNPAEGPGGKTDDFPQNDQTRQRNIDNTVSEQSVREHQHPERPEPRPEQPKNPAEQRRNRGFLGFLTGHLKQAKRELRQDKAVIQRQKDNEIKAEQK